MKPTSLALVTRRLLGAVTLGLGLAALAACSSDEGEPPAPAATLTHDEYCEVVAPFLLPVERAYVGSDQHVADIAEIKDLSGPVLAEALEVLERHYDEQVDPANPDSQNFPNFPQDVKAAALFVDSELRELCGG